jgi:serpin B
MPVEPPPTETTAKADPDAEPAPTPRDEEAQPEAAPGAKSANAFTLALYRRARREPGNLMLSGTSLRSALSATYLGARGQTAREMAKALSLPPSVDDAASEMRAELADWTAARGKTGSASLDIASRVWADGSLSPAPAFTERASAIGAPPDTVDFLKAPEAARTRINAWVASATENKIPDLLPPGSVTPQTRLVVTNATYFKGRWLEPFPKDKTKDAPFHVDAKTTRPVPTMHVTNSFRYAEAPGVRAVEMTYEGTDLAMLVVLPDDAAGLAALERDLGEETLSRWTSALAQQRVAISLPKFTFRSGGAMNPALKDLGLATAFGQKADFSGMLAKGERVHLDQVFQKTWIAVDETGTEAAAASGAVMRTTSLVVGEPVEFRADRPFLFFVRDVRRDRVLFVGRVADPTA